MGVVDSRLNGVGLVASHEGSVEVGMVGVTPENLAKPTQISKISPRKPDAQHHRPLSSGELLEVLDKCCICMQGAWLMVKVGSIEQNERDGAMLWVLGHFRWCSPIT